MNGIYHVQFKSSLADFGGGLIVIKDRSVNGGDEHFLYQGTLREASNSVTAQIEVKKWRSGNRSVFGIDNFHLELSGTLDARGLNLTGHVVGQPNMRIEIAGSKVAEAM